MGAVKKGYPCPECVFVGTTKKETEDHVREKHYPDAPRAVGWASCVLAVLAILAIPIVALAQDQPAADGYQLYATPVLNVQADTVSFRMYEDINGNGIYDADAGEEPSWWATAITVEVFEGRAPTYNTVAHPDGTTDAIALLPGTFIVQAGYTGIMSGCAFGSTTFVVAGGSTYTVFINLLPCPAG